MSKERLILLANDFHIAKDNIEEFRKNWEEMEKVAQEYDCEFVHIGGDLFDSPTLDEEPEEKDSDDADEEPEEKSERKEEVESESRDDEEERPVHRRRRRV